MDAKSSLMEAVEHLQTSTVKGSDVWQGYEGLKNTINKETDPRKLGAMLIILREEIKKVTSDTTNLFDTHGDANPPGNNSVPATATPPPSGPRLRRRPRP